MCVSHLRWAFVFQRPQHLLSRAAKEGVVLYVEEPIVGEGPPRIEVTTDSTGVLVAVSRLPAGLSNEEQTAWQQRLLAKAVATHISGDYVLWSHAHGAGVHAPSDAGGTVYDCMDELSAFAGAPPGSRAERSCSRADLVFTGGQSLYEAKRRATERARLSEQRRRRPFRARARTPHRSPRIRRQSRIRDSDFTASSTNAWTTNCWPGLPLPAGLAAGADRPDREDRPREVAARGQHPLPRPETVRRIAGLYRRLGRRDDAVRAQRGDAFHQSDQDAGISRRRSAGGVDLDSRRGAPVRPAGAGAHRRHRARSSSRRSTRRWPRIRTARLRAADAFLTHMSWDGTWRRMRARSSRPLPTAARAAPTRAARRNSRTEDHVFDYLVVGAGFAGRVLAERLAAGLGKQVLLLDKRPHIGGNAYDYHDEHGVLIHKYGPHIFHTNSREVFSYLSRFTEWFPYQHRVRAWVDGRLVPIPINLDTINRSTAPSFTLVPAG